MVNSLRQLLRGATLLTISLVAVAPAMFAGCTPGDSITASESDVVATVYDNTFDFGSMSTFALPDTIMHLTGDPDEPDDPNLSRDDDAQILAQIASGFESRGYTRVYPDSAGNPMPDFIVSLGATSTDFYSLYSYWPGYPGYGWCYYCGSGWYPGYPYPPSTGVSYAYTTGTLITLVTKVESSGSSDSVPSQWVGAINGVLNDTNTSTQNRLQKDIDQMFAQSPYLKAN